MSETSADNKIESLAETISRHGLSARKSLGQHFLANSDYCQKIAQFAQIGPEDTVVEIGPGTGQLTRVLLPLARKVIAVEFDRDLVRYLNEHFLKETEAAKHLDVIQADILSFDWAVVGNKPFKVVGNLPYSIATQILQNLLPIKDRFQSGTFLLQKCNTKFIYEIIL